jgi:hypothetical protein
MNENPETIWTKSEWKAADLDHKSVEFQIPLKKGGGVHDVGEIWARNRKDGFLSVWIVTEYRGRNWAERIQTVYVIPQLGVDRLKKHPDPNVAEFCLILPV